ncbi:hypothetical protein KC337_g96 [Hortaea werneckii]|nr:hypothetical protein KC337_g96 [Hortaea werneckii]
MINALVVLFLPLATLQSRRAFIVFHGLNRTSVHLAFSTSTASPSSSVFTVKSCSSSTHSPTGLQQRGGSLFSQIALRIAPLPFAHGHAFPFSTPLSHSLQTASHLPGSRATYMKASRLRKWCKPRVIENAPR